MTVVVDAEGVVAFTQELVRIRSESESADLVAAKMLLFGWDPAFTEAAPGRPNVVAIVEGGGGPGPTLLFEGHTDVVTEGDPSDWARDPFGGEIVDGRLHGRGSADMKSGLAACLYAVRALQLAGPFPGRIVVCALVDEEGMMLGAKAFAATALAREVDGAIIAEPEAGEICLVAKGAIRLRVSFAGAMAHGAMPQHGRNPIPAAGRLLASLADLQAELQKAHPAHEHLGEVYMTPTVLSAGSADQINVIPAHCTVCVDVRTIPGVSHSAVVSRVAALATSAGEPEGVRSSVEVVDDRPPVDTPSSHPLVGALAAAHETVYGAPAVYGGVPGATDGTILTRDAEMVTIVYGPGGKWIAHQADEFVDVDEIVNCTRVFAEAARLFLGG